MGEFRTRRRIEFSDTDAGGQVHFSRFFAFMETAEDEFLLSLGASFDMRRDGRRLAWPKVAAACDYRSPLHYGDEVEIALRVERRGTRSLTYAFTFRRDGREVARGRTVSVLCAEKPGGGYEAVPIPADLLARITDASR
jgi:YbgC/YbaW family acyl-CoA thioester hydrolase